MSTLLQTFDMTTDRTGLIQLLARNLYADVHVFVRELIQNAGDGITLRRAVEPDHEGRIEVFAYPAQRTIIFRDNGLGLDEDGIKRFLSVIGSTGTGAARRRLAASDPDAARQLVGQFGIGMLSAFVVAEKVIVRTRKLGADRALAWHNEGSTECRLYSDDKPDAGTEVVVILDDRYAHLNDPETLRRTIRKYCDFILYPIHLDDEGPVNAMRAPWHQKHWSDPAEKRRAYGAFLNERFPDFALRVIPVEIDGKVTARGALYVTESKIPDLTSNGRVDLYVRRFLISSGDAEILPPWAKFIGGIIDCPDLQPTASRDNIQRGDPALAALREALAGIIVDDLISLAADDPQEFARINERHHYHLKGMALFHDDFFEAVAPHLLFDTNRGKLSLNGYLDLQAALGPASDPAEPVPLHCFGRKQDRRFYYEMADRQELVVFDCRRVFDLDLLAKLAAARPGRLQVRSLDAELSPALFRTASLEDADLAVRLEIGLLRHLRQAGFRNVEVLVRSFQPASAASVVLATARSQAQQSLRDLVRQDWILSSLGELTRQIAEIASEAPPVRLVVNLAHPLVRRIGALEDPPPQIMDIMAALLLDRPAGNAEILDDALREHADRAKQRILEQAVERALRDGRAAASEEA